MTASAIRPATAADLDSLTALEAACFGAEAWSRRLLAEELDVPSALPLVTADRAGAAPEGSLFAYAVFRRAAGEAELLRVAVHPAARRRGLAAALVDAGLDRLRAEGSEACFLEVAAGNAPAVALYRRLGFRPAGRRPRYYRTGEDALLMRLELSPPGGGSGLGGGAGPGGSADPGGGVTAR